MIEVTLRFQVPYQLNAATVARISVEGELESIDGTGWIYEFRRRVDSATLFGGLPDAVCALLLVLGSDGAGFRPSEVTFLAASLVATEDPRVSREVL